MDDPDVDLIPEGTNMTDAERAKKWFYVERMPHWPRLHIKAWRTHLWVYPVRFAFGLVVENYTVSLYLLRREYKLQLWSHPEDCDCDKCLPF